MNSSSLSPALNAWDMSPSCDHASCARNPSGYTEFAKSARCGYCPSRAPILAGVHTLTELSACCSLPRSASANLPSSPDSAVSEPPHPVSITTSVPPPSRQFRTGSLRRPSFLNSMASMSRAGENPPDLTRYSVWPFFMRPPALSRGASLTSRSTPLSGEMCLPPSHMRPRLIPALSASAAIMRMARSSARSSERATTDSVGTVNRLSILTGKLRCRIK